MPTTTDRCMQQLACTAAATATAPQTGNSGGISGGGGGVLRSVTPALTPLEATDIFNTLFSCWDGEVPNAATEVRNHNTVIGRENVLVNVDIAL